MEYRVQWEIDINADGPQQAAKEARRIQQDLSGESLATFFTVTDERGKTTTINLKTED